ncbi:hypothetical protein CEXT_571801 [Caerostris extrusa]|uniref:Uncharacterized protein n=1 Tax=Caerostris extrusa TaxID=172846 RepID=A0AAV4PIE3_CAEEX|nr:hypothetical protein CEXT_571801 [Caerostris extrusa]
MRKTLMVGCAPTLGEKSPEVASSHPLRTLKIDKFRWKERPHDLSRHMKPEEEDLMSGTGPDERRPCLRKWSGPAGDKDGAPRRRDLSGGTHPLQSACTILGVSSTFISGLWSAAELALRLDNGWDRWVGIFFQATPESRTLSHEHPTEKEIISTL